MVPRGHCMHDKRILTATCNFQGAVQLGSQKSSIWCRVFIYLCMCALCSDWHWSVVPEPSSCDRRVGRGHKVESQTGNHRVHATTSRTTGMLSTCMYDVISSLDCLHAHHRVMYVHCIDKGFWCALIRICRELQLVNWLAAIPLLGCWSIWGEAEHSVYAVVSGQCLRHQRSCHCKCQKSCRKIWLRLG